MLAKGLSESGNEVTNEMFFDTIKVFPRLDQSEIRLRANEIKINLRYYEDGGVSFAIKNYILINNSFFSRLAFHLMRRPPGKMWLTFCGFSLLQKL